MDIEAALTIVERCCIGAQCSSQQTVDAMSVVNTEIERLTLENNQLHTRIGHLEADIAELEDDAKRDSARLNTQSRSIASLFTERAECRRLLREAVTHRRDDTGVTVVQVRWFDEAAAAAGATP